MATPDDRLGPATSDAHSLVLNASDTPKKRALSDSTPLLDPSPRFVESTRRSRDDDSLIATPTKQSRSVDLSARGLQLHMPRREDSHARPVSALASGPCAGLGIEQAQIDDLETYESPSSVLPRHSRGIDFSRAATNLHHSTLAEPQSPESSPVIAQRNMPPPLRRGSTNGMALDSPRASSAMLWGWGGPINGDRGLSSRPTASTNALNSDGSSNTSDDDDVLMAQDDTDLESVVGTPLVQRMHGTNAITPFDLHRSSLDFAPPTTSSTGAQSPVPGSFATYRRNVFGKRLARTHRDHPYQRNRTSSPEVGSGSAAFQNSNLYSSEPAMRSPPSRRESLSLGIGTGLHITSSNDDAEEGPFGMANAASGVVRRPVTRRSNLLPKTKNFARIRAALQEENSPVDSDVRRESEVVRQVRVNDVGLNDHRGTTPSSPDLTPSVRNMSHDSSEMSDPDAFGVRGGPGSGTVPDLRRASSVARWQQARYRSQTPPPPPLPPPAVLNRHRSSSGISEDICLDSPEVSTPPSSVFSPSTNLSDPAASLPSIEPTLAAPFPPPNLPSAADISRKINKRRRDEDMDFNSFKRRAVSPGMSLQNSPVLGQSPVSNSGCWPGKSRESSIHGLGDDKSQSNLTGHPTPTFGPKRVGLQGMTDTSETLMKMSID